MVKGLIPRFLAVSIIAIMVLIPIANAAVPSVHFHHADWTYRSGEGGGYTINRNIPIPFDDDFTVLIEDNSTFADTGIAYEVTIGTISGHYGFLSVSLVNATYFHVISANNPTKDLLKSGNQVLLTFTNSTRGMVVASGVNHVDLVIDPLQNSGDENRGFLTVSTQIEANAQDLWVTYNDLTPSTYSYSMLPYVLLTIIPFVLFRKIMDKF